MLYLHIDCVTLLSRLIPFFDWLSRIFQTLSTVFFLGVYVSVRVRCKRGECSSESWMMVCHSAWDGTCTSRLNYLSSFNCQRSDCSIENQETNQEGIFARARWTARNDFWKFTQLPTSFPRGETNPLASFWNIDSLKRILPEVALGRKSVGMYRRFCMDVTERSRRMSAEWTKQKERASRRIVQAWNQSCEKNGKVKWELHEQRTENKKNLYRGTEIDISYIYSPFIVIFYKILQIIFFTRLSFSSPTSGQTFDIRTCYLSFDFEAPNATRKQKCFNGEYTCDVLCICFVEAASEF